MQALIDYIDSILTWFYDLILWWPRFMAEVILNALAALIEALPVPSWLQSAPSYLGAVDPGVAYFLEGFLFEQGLTIIFAAYVIRFGIRRIPIVG